uniref:disease resistance protein RPV1-like n=1 Tax=Erigeron canadensis TaxID=72917 RepID=UPI001CB928D3|nr:disease resistance protein RPV1-like [Erigeron canadensis]
MASTSASPSIQRMSFKYDVFISFRGADTRKNFVDHLYHALMQKSILTYKDDERIKKGEKISDELITAIEDSRFYVIVFSKNYASSSWCLDELVQIMEECHKSTFHTAYPVFYDVEPTEIRYQSGSVGEVFSQLENQEAAAGKKWREALKDAADLAGSVLKNTFDGHEAKFIQKIVETISLDLRFIDSGIDGKLIGMESRVKDVVSALEIGSDDVRIIGIKGMGGAGKTTLARAIFDHISVQFEGQSFVENVREEVSKSGLKKLQKHVLSDVVSDHGVKVSSVNDTKNMMKKMMCGRKVLLVLDDVDNIEQLEALAGEPNWFKPGSRIIITTRDEQVLVAHRVNLILDVNLLSVDEAVCLFSRYAFGKEIPIDGYEELSRQVVQYAAGLPLTIRVLGSFLCGKNELEWIDALDRLKTIPLRETLKKLELSYIGLEDDYKEIFLDVACILKGWQKYEAIEVLESCGFHARIGLRVLEQRSLITISKYDRLGMHDHIEEMGKNIVRRLHPNEPNRHSRLWIEEEIVDVFANDLGTEATRCLKFDMNVDCSVQTIIKGLGNMKKLRMLVIYGNGDVINDREVLDQCLPNALRYISWDHYPFESLMKSFQKDHLVGLSLYDSAIKQFWKCGKTKVLKKLRFLDMNISYLRTLDLEMFPNIETLSLQSCHKLLELHMPVCCPKLKYVNVDRSILKTLNLGSTLDLETLNLQNCYKLSELHMPVRCPKLKSLNVKPSKLRTLNLGSTPNLETLNLVGCDYLIELHMPFRCPKLKSLSLNCFKLRTLNMGEISDLETLILENCCDLVEFHMPIECPKLNCLWIMNSALRNLSLGFTPELEMLNLRGCRDLVELNMPLECSKLKDLNLQDCTMLRTLKLVPTPDLKTLTLARCHDLL